MLSEKTLAYLSSKPDVNDKEIDALVEYAATSKPDAWIAIKVMHERGHDDLILPYLARLSDPRLIELGNYMTYLWKRAEAYEQHKREQQAEADAQPETIQKEKMWREMIDHVSQWLQKQSIEVSRTMICKSIEATIKARKLRCKQDWAGFLRLIRNEAKWLNNLTNSMFVEMVTERCKIDESNLPNVSTLKVLSFGTQPFPNWKVEGYSPSQLDSLTQMVGHFVEKLHDQVEKTIGREQQSTFAV